jgi:hypothetical protein
MSIDTIRSSIEKANQGLAEIRAQLQAVRKEHEEKLREVDAMLASLPTPKPVKAPPKAAPKPASGSKGPTTGEEIIGLATSQPGITAAALAAALPHRPKKSVVNTASRLVGEGRLVRQAKGYAAPPVAAE